MIDANAIIGDIRWMVKHRTNPAARTALQEAIASRTLVAFAPTFLDDEIRLNLRELSNREGLALGPMLAAWEEYRACIRFYRAQRPSATTTLGVADTKDVPYVETYLALGAAAILTNDPHLARMQARTVRLELAVAMRDYARAASIELTLKWHGMILLTFGVGIVQQFVQVLGAGARAFRRMPRYMQVLIGAGVLAALLHRPTRERLTRALQSALTGVRAFAMESLPLLADLFGETRTHEVKARAAWQQVAPHVPPRHVPLRVHVVAICASGETPLGTEQLIRRLADVGVNTGARSFGAICGQFFADSV